MAKRKGPTANPAKLAALNAKFDKIAELVAAWDDQQRDTDDGLYAALGQLFDFGEALRSDEMMMRDFLVNKGQHWGKVTQDNPYNGLVKLAFPRATRASWSQYSSVLRLANESKPSDVSLPDWIRAVENKLSSRYKEAIASKRPVADELKTSIRQSHIDTVMMGLAQQALSAPVAVASDPPTIEGYARALIRVTDGMAVIVDVDDWDQGEMERYLLARYPAPAARREVLDRRPLGKLHRAVDLVVGLTHPEASGGQQVILLEPRVVNGVAQCRVSNVGRELDFPVAAVTVAEFVESLTPGEIYMLGINDAKTFLKNFVSDDEWSIQRGDGSAGHVLGSARHLIPLPLLVQPGMFRSARRPMQQTKHFSLSVNMAADFLKWREMIMNEINKRNAKVKELIARPKLLNLEVSGRAMHVSVDALSNLQTSILELNAAGTITDDRWLSFDDVVAVYATLERQGVNARGWFVDMEEADAGVCFSATLTEGSLEVIVPTVKSRAGTYAQTCEELKASWSWQPAGVLPTRRTTPSVRPGQRQVSLATIPAKISRKRNKHNRS